MKSIALASLFLFLFPGQPQASETARQAFKSFQDLTPGHYEIRIDGILCRSCVKIIAEEAASLKEVESARADFDHETLFLTVKNGNVLKISKLRKALGKAAKRIDLDTRYEIDAIKYNVSR